jgi:hypothetical protein
MASIDVIIGETARLALTLEDGNVAQYPRVNIYNPGISLPLATLNLVHLSEGLYEVPWVPPGLGTYNAVYTVYQDVGHTVPSTKYSKELDQLIVRDDLEQQIKTLLEEVKVEVEAILAQQDENTFIDNTVYDDCCQVLSSRIRIFDTKAHCELATDGGSETLGLLATYQIVVDYEGPSKMKTYRKVRL